MTFFSEVGPLVGREFVVPNASIAFLAISRNSSSLKSSSDVATIWMSGASSDWSK